MRTYCLIGVGFVLAVLGTDCGAFRTVNPNKHVFPAPLSRDALPAAPSGMGAGQQAPRLRQDVGGQRGSGLVRE
jgi:hypothetical protein